ncbi:MAG: FecR family protein [Dyadobacter sp.]|uniref:FecR family protein n=1 Tax=Dyadobacter sp. TaxID=1914288 RepID=UPI00326451A1
MEGYKDYAAEDFIQDDRFRKWVLSNDVETNAFWREFLSRFPEKQPVILAARATLNAVKNLQKMPDAEQGNRMWENILSQTNSEMEWEEEIAPVNNVRYLWRWAAAACITLLFCSLGWYLFNQKTETRAISYSEQVEQVTSKLHENVNSTNKNKLITLPDGSTVTLAPSSRISYQDEFSGDKREVYLSGKGFFNVVKDTDKPFFVYANRLLTQVVGTSFTVTSSAVNASASVVVKSGKVKVYALEPSKKSANGLPENMVVLMPNMQVVYDPDQDLLTKSFISEPAILHAPASYPDFSFENTSVSKVFETLEESYGVKIAYDAKTVESCNLTAPLGNEPLFRKLDIICQTIDATYEVRGTEIIISGKGCKTE